MRIISNFHDYYDSCKAYDQENTPMFQRKSEEHFFEHSWIDREKNHSLIKELISNNYICIKNDSLSYNSFLILFCGKIYCGMKLNYSVLNSFGYRTDISKIVYAEESFYKFLEENKLDLKKILSKKHYFSEYINKCFHKNTIKEYFAKNGLKHNLEFFRKYNSPIITFKETGRSNSFILTINDCLKDYDFFKIFDPFTVYQEINMFVSGFLTNPEIEMSKISDDLKVQSHGFDKWSFRKMPEKC